MSAVGRYRLLAAMKDLKIRWERARLRWDDPVSKDIEATVIEPLEPKVRAAVAAMEKLGEAMARARQECG